MHLRNADILLIEDSPTQAQQFQLWLSYAGYSVDIIQDGAEGLLHARHANPRLILLDIELPTISGFHILACLKRDQRTQHTPIVMLTNHAGVQNAMRAKRLGAECLISKYTDREQFCALVEAALQLTNAVR